MSRDVDLSIGWRKRAAVHLAAFCAAALIVPTGAQALAVQGFEGTSLLDNCALFGCFRPPDTMGAIGTRQYVETTNGSITVYDRANGSVLSRVAMTPFWMSVGQAGSSGDQRVLFDLYTHRWIMTGLGASVAEVVIAVSDTDDALGSWKSTKITALPGGIADYPTLAMDDKGVYIGTNNFKPGFTGTSLFVIPKADLFGGAPTTANMTTITRATGGGSESQFTLQGATNWQGNADATTPILSTSVLFNDQMWSTVSGVDGPGATAGASQYLGVAAYGTNGKGRQPDGTRLVDTLDQRMSASVNEVGGKVYAAFTATPVGGSYTEIRWLVVDAATGVLLDQGTLGGSGYDYYQPAIAVNEFGEAVITYNRSGYAKGDLDGDGKDDGRISILAQPYSVNASGGLETFGSELLLKVSGMDDYRCGPPGIIDLSCRQRWGDYAAVTLDPLDRRTFWMIGEYAARWAMIPELGDPRAIWHTYIASLSFDGVPPPVPEPGTLLLLLIGLGGLVRVRTPRG